MCAYKECIGILDRIVSYIKSTDDYNKELLIQIYEMRAFIADTTIEELKTRLDELQKKYDYLSRSFLLKTQNTLLTVISECGPYIISTFIGHLLGRNKTYNNYYVNQHDNIGGNIIGAIGAGVK